MKMRHWFSGAALLGALVLAFFGLFGGAAVLFGLSSLIELVAAMVNDKNTNV
jgi:hypothetical protein